MPVRRPGNTLSNRSTPGMTTRKSGTYALIARAEKSGTLIIGRLGRLQTQSGYYVYIGSAFGPGGINARISHHSRYATRPHWHMDYLRPRVDIIEIWYTTDERNREHQWANHLAAHRLSYLPLHGFGASDCSCTTHLFHFNSKPSGHYFRKRIRQRYPSYSTINIFTLRKNQRENGCIFSNCTRILK